MDNLVPEDKITIYKKYIEPDNTVPHGWHMVDFDEEYEIQLKHYRGIEWEIENTQAYFKSDEHSFRTMFAYYRLYP